MKNAVNQLEWCDKDEEYSLSQPLNGQQYKVIYSETHKFIASLLPLDNDNPIWQKGWIDTIEEAKQMCQTHYMQSALSALSPKAFHILEHYLN